jgi:hypothetical protein
VYGNVPAVPKVRDSDPVVKVCTFVGEPATCPKVTLWPTPELLFQVTVPVEMIVTVDGLNVLLLVIATSADAGGFPSGPVESPPQAVRTRMSHNGRMPDTAPPMKGPRGRTTQTDVSG